MVTNRSLEGGRGFIQLLAGGDGDVANLETLGWSDQLRRIEIRELSKFRRREIFFRFSPSPVEFLHLYPHLLTLFLS